MTHVVKVIYIARKKNAKLDTREHSLECKTCYNIAKLCSRVSSDISFKQRNRKLVNRTGKLRYLVYSYNYFAVKLKEYRKLPCFQRHLYNRCPFFTGAKISQQAILHTSPQNPDNSSFIQNFQEQDIGSSQDSTPQCISPHKKHQLQNTRNRSLPPYIPDLDKSREILGLAIEKKLKAHPNSTTFKPKKRFLLKTPRKECA